MEEVQSRRGLGTRTPCRCWSNADTGLLDLGFLGWACVLWVVLIVLFLIVVHHTTSVRTIHGKVIVYTIVDVSIIQIPCTNFLVDSILDDMRPLDGRWAFSVTGRLASLDELNVHISDHEHPNGLTETYLLIFGLKGFVATFGKPMRRCPQPHVPANVRPPV